MDLSHTQDEVTVVLREGSPVKYSKDGSFLDSFEVQVCAPSKKQYKKTYVLQQHLTRAILEAKGFLKNIIDETEVDDADDADEKSIDANTLHMMLLSSTVDLEDCMTRFQTLALAGCIKVADNPMNDAQWDDNMHPRDQEKCMVEFMANFILPSVMETLGD